ncbi:TPA: hypothetical protein NNA95_000754 [Pseudomonas aeruginosa]|nr:hypothetical protein [Pseudomonas aeruginosa]HCH7673133.1 hypothetical protein [Pseudomonas aeruginosa]HCH9723991.1 hypothetical protein [Pseudomonas aeruginosa]HCI3167843.1 hypothetical protein [Pseudomonas aeruginosa]HCI3557981.1 hypothetical protein [Pseudomonas aeruginosa]
MEVKNCHLVIALISLMLFSTGTRAECYGEGEYEVCSEVEVDADDNITARSWDTDGNTYEINTETHQIPNGHETVTTDTDGNEYSIRTWTDSEGSHTQDSDGNICTITHTGKMIGCE